VSVIIIVFTKDSFAITQQQYAACYDETSLSVLLNHKYIQGVTGGTDQTSGGCSLC
jgi:hypothetical protein